MKILLVDAESPFSRAVAYCLARVGHQVFGVSRDAVPAVFRLSRYCAGYRRVPDLGGVLEFARERCVDLIMATGLDGLRFVALHRVELERVAPVAAGPSASQLDIVSNKAQFAEFARAHGLPHPRTVQLGEAAEYPALLKPARGEMGWGIRLVESEAELAQERGDWILQAYVPGTDLGCSVLCRDGKILAYTIQRGIVWRSRPYAPPLGVEFILDEEVLSVVSQLVASLRWNGVANIDLRRDSRDGRVRILEVNGRYWATMLASERAGVNFAALVCRDALGERFPRPNYREGLRTGGVAAYLTRSSGMRLRDATFQVALADPLPVLARAARWFQAKVASSRDGLRLARDDS